MPQIPTLPIDEPVELPRAKPAIFGSAGETIAGLGAETEQMAQANLAFEGHLIYAQRQLKAKQAEIDIDKHMNELYNALSKTTTVDDAQAVAEQAQNPDTVGTLLAPYEKDHRLGQMVNLAWQQAQVQFQGKVNEHKAHIIVAGTHAADAVNEEKTIQQAISVGDSKTFRDRYEMGLRAGEQSGVYSPQVVDEMLLAWDRKYQKGRILAQINSPSSLVRQDVIKQLSMGGGSLEHSALNAEELGQLYTHAVDTDHSLTQKEEASSLNGALNIASEWFSSPEYKHPDGTPDDEAIQKALTDGKQLVDHGITTPDGKPNFVMADKIDEHYARLWNMNQKVQRDKDEAVLEKYSPMIYDPNHPLTIARIEALPQTDGASSRAVNQLKTALFQEQRQAKVLRNEERSLNLEERRLKRQELEDRSTATSLALTDRMAKGDPIDFNKDILEPVSKGQLTPEEGKRVWSMYKDSDQYPEIGEGVGIIAAPFKAMPDTPENHRKAADARDSFLKAVKDKNLHGADILKEAQSIAEHNGKAATSNILDNMFNLLHGIAPIPAPKTTAPVRPKGVPDNAVWNPTTRTWQIQQP